MTDLPDTPLSDVAAQLRETIDDGYHSGYYHGSKTLQETLDDGGILHPFSFNGREFEVLYYPKASRHSSGWLISAVLFDPEQDVESTDIEVGNLEKIEKRKIRSSHLDDEEARDDIEHALATLIGYFVRAILDGREYAGYGDHEKPVLANNGAV